MATSFSTHDVHPRDRLAFWREVATKGFVSHEFCTDLGPGYQGSVRLASLAGLGIAEFECDPGDISRTKEHISSSDSDDLLICAQIAGEGAAAQDGRRGAIEGGSFCVLDPRRPFTATMHTKTKSVILQVPRQRLEVRVGSLGRLTARAMDIRMPLSALASGFLTMLPTCTETLDSVAEGKLAEQALDLVALAFSAEADRRVGELSSPRACTLLRLKAEIETRLTDPDLKPSTVAEATGISVRYANALLSAEGTSLERYILTRRLERCRGALDDPVQARRSIGEIAFGWGFSDLSHFGRRFKSAFGSAPSEYRRRAG
jgi:AraC-like DNA-binding protein